MEVRIADSIQDENKVTSICFGLFDSERILGEVWYREILRNQTDIFLKSIFISEHYRKLGLGSFLLEESEKQLKENGVRDIYAVHNSFDSDDSFDEFLSSNKYMRLNEDSIILDFSLGEINEAVLKKNIMDFHQFSDSIVTLEDISSSKYSKYMESLKQNGVFLHFDSVDKKYTSILLEKDEISAALLVKRTGNIIKINDYYTKPGAKQAAFFPTLFFNLAKNLLDKGEAPDTRLTVTVYDKNILKGLETLLGVNHRSGVSKGYFKVL